ncbi:ABC transporter substrate-binding protein [Actinomadura rupiterrae]|uniref:ABC transporter substrate-binding protein n=1 Tax=Actinomadura rupiterrae TaxID=559627 RepID=UPI0020A5AB0B|nr:ABC transporter substrate-binding protein [Actinomadura rupiterrae]MCP2339010.1 NitT/TauT family transport system substrate-binding protein [Actinomadura rupiterrae]
MRFPRALSAVLAAALALSACGGSGDKHSGGKNGLEKTDLKVGIIPIADSAAVPIAVNKGYFKAEGLNVKFEPIQGGAIGTQRLMAGSLDVTLSNYVSVFLARDKGTMVKVIADAAEARPDLFPIVVPKDSPIKSVADLKGKRIAVNTLKNVAELAVVSTLKLNDVDAKDVHFVEFAFPEMPAALQKGAADAALLTEPFLTGGRAKLGLRTIADSMTGATANLPIAGWEVSEKFTKQNPHTVAAFQRAIARAQRDAASNRPELNQTITGYAKIDPQLVKIITLPGYPITLNPTRIQRVPDLMVRFGYLKQTMDAKAALATQSG